MGKKNPEEMAKERPKFIEGAAETHKVPAEKAGEVFDLLEKFANYGFNKSHAAAYAVVSYQTAWLKANHPVEFMAAVMNCDIHLTDKLAVYKREVDKLGIKTVAPCVNASLATFSVQDGAVVYALGRAEGRGGRGDGIDRRWPCGQTLCHAVRSCPPGGPETGRQTPDGNAGPRRGV